MTEPSVLGVYRIVGKIGEGAMGLVYEGRHDVLGRRVAIKVLRPELARDVGIATRFMNEARAANAISHENIVNIYDVGETPEGAPYLVMELLEGETLFDLERKGPMAPRQAAAIFAPMLRALAAAHGRGVVHRDLKPANIFLSARAGAPPLVKVLDFGVAKLSAQLAEKMTKTGTMIGTPTYMSPEQISGKHAEPRSDLFTVGVMLYEALVGQPPFKGATMGELAHQILNVDPVPASELRAEVSPALDALLARSMAKAPDKRFPHATAMLEALEAAVPASGAAPRPVARTSLTRRRAPIFIGLGLAGAGVVAAIVATRGGEEKKGPVVVATPDAAPPAADPRVAAEEAVRAALLSKDLGEAGDAVAALDLAATPRTASLLYLALQGPPELRRQAAHVLERLDVPEAAPRVRAALDASGDRLRVELAAVLAELGDREATAILRKGLEEPGTRLNAALGLVAAGEGETARPVLVEIFDGAPRGRGEWQRAAGGLLALDEARARDGLVEELAQPDAARAIAAAAILARAGRDEGKAFLGRVAADKDHTRRGAAALALARLGDRGGLAFVPVGLASADPEDRRLAAAVAAHLADASQRAALARLAAAEPDRRTRLTAAAALLALGEDP